MKLRFYSLIIFCIVCFFDQLIYRYAIIINIGTNIRLLDFLTFLLIIIYVGSKTKKLHPSKDIGFLKFILITFCIIVLISIYRGLLIDPNYAFGIGRYSILEFSLIPVIAGTLDSYKKIITLVNVIIVTIFISIIFHLLLNLNIASLLLQANEEGRFLDSYTVAGIAAIFLICIPLSLFYPQKKIKLNLINSKLILISLFAFLVLIQERSVWVAVAVALLMMVALAWFNKKAISRKAKIRIAISVLLGIFVFIIFIGLFPNFFTELLTNRLAFLYGVENDPNGYWRILAWTNSINETIKNNLIFGLGMIASPWFTPGGNLVYVWEHNQYVFLFRVTGLVGVILYILFLIKSALFNIKLLKTSSSFGKYLLLGLYSALISQIIYSIFYMQTVFLIIIIGMIISVYKIESCQMEAASS